MCRRRGMERSEYPCFVLFPCEFVVLNGYTNHQMCVSRIEVAVKQILSGMEVKTNASVANLEALDWFREWARKVEAAAAAVI